VAKNINFLREKVAKFKKKAKKLLLVRTISLFVMTTYVIAVLLIVSYHLFVVQKKNQNLKAEIEEETKVVKEFQPIETKQIFLATKIRSLTAILDERKKYHQVIDSFLKLLPEDVFLTGLEIKEAGLVNFSGKCFRFTVLGNFLEVLKEQEESAILKVQETKIEELGYGYGEGYFFRISLLFYGLEKEEIIDSNSKTGVVKKNGK